MTKIYNTPETLVLALQSISVICASQYISGPTEENDGTTQPAF